MKIYLVIKNYEQGGENVKDIVGFKGTEKEAEKYCIKANTNEPNEYIEYTWEIVKHC